VCKGEKERLKWEMFEIEFIRERDKRWDIKRVREKIKMRDFPAKPR
jgi:hypothetical protein